MIVRNPLLWKEFLLIDKPCFILCVSVYRHHVGRSTNPPEFGHSRPADPDSHCGEAAGAADNPGRSTSGAAMCYSCVLAEFKMVGIALSQEWLWL